MQKARKILHCACNFAWNGNFPGRGLGGPPKTMMTLAERGKADREEDGAPDVENWEQKQGGDFQRFEVL